jgi:glycosyltransferase involved in cell wall biosynthesis
VKISVITAVFNGEATIADNLRSVAAQDWPDVEHIVMDGASRDRTPETVRQQGGPKVRLISEPDRGVYDAMNKGIRQATGEVIGLLNADDVYADEHVLRRVSEAMADPTVDACYGDLLYVRREQPDKVVRYWKAGEFDPERLRAGWFPPHPTFYVRRIVYERCGLFDLQYPLGGDVEFMMRALGKYHVRPTYIPQVMVRMRLGGISNANLANVVRQNMAIRRAAKVNGIPMNNAVSYYTRKLAERMTQFLSRPDES